MALSPAVLMDWQDRGAENAGALVNPQHHRWPGPLRLTRLAHQLRFNSKQL